MRPIMLAAIAVDLNNANDRQFEAAKILNSDLHAQDNQEIMPPAEASSARLLDRQFGVFLKASDFEFNSRISLAKTYKQKRDIWHRKHSAEGHLDCERVVTFCEQISQTIFGYFVWLVSRTRNVNTSGADCHRKREFDVMFYK